MQTTAKALFAAGLIALTGMVGAPTAGLAQSSDGSQQQAQPKTDWSDQKLQSFVQTAMAVRDVYAEWRPKMEKAESDKQRKQMRKKANDAALKKVRSSSLTVEEYTQINRAMRKDPEFFNKVRGLMKDARK
jgi:hypothetical protein